MARTRTIVFASRTFTKASDGTIGASGRGRIPSAVRAALVAGKPFTATPAKKVAPPAKKAATKPVKPTKADPKKVKVPTVGTKKKG
jgi:hypothetical protein